jgi:hypothetical protein
MRQVVRDCSSVSGTAPILKSATVLGSACDLLGFEGCIARFHCGVFGDSQSATVYIEAELQDSDDGVTYAAVADALLDFPSAFAARTGHAVGTFFQSKTDAAADTAGLYEIGYRGAKRYLKVNIRLTGTHTSGTIVSASFLRMLPREAPAR